MKTIKPVILGILALQFSFDSVHAQDTHSSPNIVFILADDFGYGSLNSYGAEKSLLRTPHIDRIAESGMLFTNVNTPSSICTPTRYGLLTGRYPWRSILKFGVTNPIDELLIKPDRMTIADWLNERGYQTAVIGKWHLGYGEKPLDYTKSMSPGPLDLGFDYHFGVPQNHGDMLGVFVENDHIYGIRSDKVHPYSRTFYGPQYLGYDAPQRTNKEVMEVLTDKSVDWIKQQSSDEPFFLFFAAVAVHHPITPSDYMRAMSDAGPYGDFIQDLDHSVGQIIETLEYMNLMDNTLIVFTSDNGGEIPGNRPEAPEITAVNYGLKINGDLKGDKHTIFQGGSNVPFIVSWPGVVEDGSESDALINLIDMFATVCEITDGEVPGSKEIAPDSYSFLNILNGKKIASNRQEMVTADANGMHALRMGDWKYIDNTPPEGMAENRLNRLQSFKPQLYNLAEDPSESNNLIDVQAKKAAEMKKELDRIRKVTFTR
ncbi:MAG: sulfatase-like hydrolase/transferase [Bacteroidales bacterium]